MIAAMKKILSILLTLGFTGYCSAEQNCEPQELSRCARPLQVLQDTAELRFVSKKEELDQLCPDLFSGLRCIHSYTRRCLETTQQAHFERLYRGTDRAIQNLCTPGEYQTRFLKHAPCMRGLKSEYEKCAAVYQATLGQLSANGSGDGPADDKLKTVCCSFQEYMGCSERVVLERCGEESAAFTREFLHGMGDSLIQSHCVDYPEGGAECSERMMGLNKSSILRTSTAAILIPVILALSAILENTASWYRFSRN